MKRLILILILALCGAAMAACMTEDIDDAAESGDVTAAPSLSTSEANIITPPGYCVDPDGVYYWCGEQGGGGGGGDGGGGSSGGGGGGGVTCQYFPGYPYDHGTYCNCGNQLKRKWQHLQYCTNGLVSEWWVYETVGTCQSSPDCPYVPTP